MGEVLTMHSGLTWSHTLFLHIKSHDMYNLVLVSLIAIKGFPKMASGRRTANLKIVEEKPWGRGYCLVIARCFSVSFSVKHLFGKVRRATKCYFCMLASKVPPQVIAFIFWCMTTSCLPANRSSDAMFRRALLT